MGKYSLGDFPSLRHYGSRKEHNKTYAIEGGAIAPHRLTQNLPAQMMFISKMTNFDRPNPTKKLFIFNCWKQYSVFE